MVHPLNGCIAKWNHAMMHIEQMKTLTSDFIKSDAYFLDSTVDEKTLEYVLIGRVQREPDLLTWGAVIGDVINNLRASLDYIVWELTVLHSGPAPSDPIPYGPPRWRTVRFPIVLEETRWSMAVSRNIWGVHPGLHTLFEELQPFRTRKDAAAREPLAVLDELWSIDKHRHPHLTQGFIGATGIRSAFRDSLPPGYALPDWFDHSFKEIVVHAPGPFKDGAELGRYVDTGTVVIPLSHLHVKADLVFDVAFEQGPPAYGGWLIETLWMLQKTVYELIGRFKPEFP